MPRVARISALAIGLLIVGIRPTYAESPQIPQGVRARFATEPSGVPGAIYAVALSPDGGQLAVSHSRHEIAVYDVRRNELVREVVCPIGSVRRLLFSPDGLCIVVATSQGVALLESATGKELDRLRLADVSEVALSQNGDVLATATTSGRIDCWVICGFRSRLKMQGLRAVEDVAFSPMGHTCVSVDALGEVQVCDLSSGQTRSWSTQGTGMCWAIECTPQGDTVAVAGNAFEMWDPQSCKRLVQLPNPGATRLLNWPPSVHFTPDGSVAVWYASEKDVYAVDVPRQSLTRLRMPFDDVTAVTLSRDGRSLVTGHLCGVAYVWDVPTLVMQESDQCNALDTDAQAWEALAGASGIRAMCALWHIVDRGKGWIPTVSQYLRSEVFAELEHAELIRELESDSFEVRERAVSQLIRLGDQVIPSVEERQRRHCNADVLARLRVVSDSIRYPTLHLSGEWARRIRCIQILEAIGGRDALDALRSLANGPGRGFDTRLAAGALRRMQTSEEGE